MKHKNHKERLNPISDAIFGAPENMDVTEAAEDLKDAGIEPEELIQRMYERLCVEARAYRTRREEVPPLLRKALDDLRPDTSPARTPEELEGRVSKTISRVLDAAKNSLLPGCSLSLAPLTSSYRNKDAQGAGADEEIISRLEQELLHDLNEEENVD